MNVYLFYIEKNELKNNIEIIIPNKNGRFILYAFTTNKEYKNEFISTRIDYFKLVKKKMNKYECKLFKEKFKSHELKKYIYDNHDYKLPILSTEFEYNECHLYWFDTIFPVDIFDKINLEDISIFKDEYVDALKKLGLTTLVVINSDPEDESSYFEDVEYDDDGKLLIRPSGIHKDIMYEMDLEPKEVNVFISIFNSLFK